MDDLYKGMRFFEDAPKSKGKHLFKNYIPNIADSCTEDEVKTVEEDFEPFETNEGEDEEKDVIKMKAQEGYNKIISDLESQDSKKKV